MMKKLRFLFAPLLIWTLFILKANICFRLYPVVMTAIMLALFLISLWRTPVAEVMARKINRQIDERSIRYYRQVTIAWIVFFAVNLVIATLTLFMDIKYWAFYNGFLSYVFMGLLFLGEWIIRRRVLK